MATRPDPASAHLGFLRLRRIAVVGVSRSGAGVGVAILRRLRSAGYEAFAVNPALHELDGCPCYPSVQAIPGGVEGVVLATAPAAAPAIARDCAAAGVRAVWMHRSLGRGSYSPEAAEICGRAGIQVVGGGCPMMFCGPVDPAHRCVRWLLGLTGGLGTPKA